MRILVVEDEARLAQTLAELLHRQGYTADISGDGLSGLDNAASDIYDLVVLDAMLPGMDGFTLLQRLRQEGHTVPVLISPSPLSRRSCWPAGDSLMEPSTVSPGRRTPLPAAICGWSREPSCCAAASGRCG